MQNPGLDDSTGCTTSFSPHNFQEYWVCFSCVWGHLSPWSRKTQVLHRAWWLDIFTLSLYRLLCPTKSLKIHYHYCHKVLIEAIKKQTNRLYNTWIPFSASPSSSHAMSSWIPPVTVNSPSVVIFDLNPWLIELHLLGPCKTGAIPLQRKTLQIIEDSDCWLLTVFN